MNLGRYAKAYVSILITALTSVQVALDHGPVTVTQWVTLGVGALVSLAGVYLVPNASPVLPVVTMQTGNVGLVSTSRPYPPVTATTANVPVTPPTEPLK